MGEELQIEVRNYLAHRYPFCSLIVFALEKITLPH